MPLKTATLDEEQIRIVLLEGLGDITPKGDKQITRLGVEDKAYALGRFMLHLIALEKKHNVTLN